MNIKEFLAQEVTMSHRVYLLTLLLAVSLTVNVAFVIAPPSEARQAVLADNQLPIWDRMSRVERVADDSTLSHEPIWERIHKLHAPVTSAATDTFPLPEAKPAPEPNLP